jgi:hypothetical protein
VFPWFLVTSYLINNLLRVEKESQEKKAYNGQIGEHHGPVFGQDPEKPESSDKTQKSPPPMIATIPKMIVTPIFLHTSI